jgi:hypothetical protein
MSVSVSVTFFGGSITLQKNILPLDIILLQNNEDETAG